MKSTYMQVQRLQQKLQKHSTLLAAFQEILRITRKSGWPTAAARRRSCYSSLPLYSPISSWPPITYLWWSPPVPNSPRPVLERRVPTWCRPGRENGDDHNRKDPNGFLAPFWSMSHCESMFHQEGVSLPLGYGTVVCKVIPVQLRSRISGQPKVQDPIPMPRQIVVRTYLAARGPETRKVLARRTRRSISSEMGIYIYTCTQT